MNILICSAGRRVSLVRYFQKELKLLFPEGKVYTTDAEPQLASACIVSDGYFKLPRLDAEDYLSKLLEVCTNNEISLVIPTIDTELALLAKEKESFRENGIEVVISSAEMVAKCRDKREIHRFFQDRGIDVAREYDKQNPEFPMFIKPSDGSRSQDTFIIRDREDIQDRHFEDVRFMFLEYLDHDKFIEYTCDLYYSRDHELKCVVPRKRIMVRDGEVSKGKTEKNKIVSFVKDKLEIVDGAEGCLTVQFFVENAGDRIVGIEVNPRFGGGYPLSYLAGANFPRWILKEYLRNETVPYFEEWEDNLLMLRYDDEILVKNYEG